MQIAHMADVQQIEGAIGQDDGVARLAPSCHLLLQFFAIEDLVCDVLLETPRRLRERE